MKYFKKYRIKRLQRKYRGIRDSQSFYGRETIGGIHSKAGGFGNELS